MDAILQYAQLYLPVLKDMVSIVSMLVASIVAILGLRTWQRQLKGTAEYDLARRVLEAVYKLRDAMFDVRLPLEDGATFLLDWDYVKQSLSDIEIAAQPLRVVTLEMEALLHKEEAEKIAILIGYGVELGVAFGNEYLDSNRPEAKVFSDEEHSRYTKLIFIPPEHKNDEFGSEVDLAVQSIETLMKPFLLKK